NGPGRPVLRRVLMSRKSAFVAAACCLLLPALCAQESRGSITGQTMDAAGALVPRVTITATNTATNIAVSATTNSTGNYTIFYLTPGVYHLTASLAGFATIQRSAIEVRVGDKLEVNFQMQPSTVTTSVEVTTDTPLLQTETASTGTVIDQR